MNLNEEFKYEIADFFISKLKEKGRGVRFSDLESWSEKLLISKMPEDDERLFSFYKKSAKDILVDLELVRIEGNIIDLTLFGRQTAEKYSVRELVEKKLKEKLFEEKKPYRDHYLRIFGLIIPIVGLLLQQFSKNNIVGYTIGWLLVGFALGFFLYDILCVRLWKN